MSAKIYKIINKRKYYTSKKAFISKLKFYLTPPIAIGYKSCCGNFSQPI